MAIGTPSPVQPRPLQGHLMSARSGVLQSQMQTRNILCYHLISCRRWSGMCKPGDREKLQRKGESEEGEGGSGKMKRKEGDWY